MAEPTLAQVFGANASQTATQLIISKADLATVGLTASATNTGESLLAAVVAFSQQQLSDTNLDTNIDQSISISDNSDTLVTRNNAVYRRKSKTIEFDKADTSANFDPDDY